MIAVGILVCALGLAGAAGAIYALTVCTEALLSNHEAYLDDEDPETGATRDLCR